MPAVTDEPQIQIHFGEKVSQISGSGGLGILKLGVPWLAGRKQDTMTLPKGKSGRTGSIITLENDTHLVGAAAVDVSLRMEEPVHQLYKKALDACASRGMHLHRAWNYVPRINELDHGLERYRQFNIGRWLAFEEFFGRDLRSFMPAASAVGAEGNQFALVFVAGKTQPQYLENPSQVPAYHYPADYGPRPPSFARAVLVKGTRETVGYLSGTASIEGHRNVGEGDWHLQFRTTMHNIQIMFERMGVMQILNAKSRGGHSRLVMRDFKVYLRHPEALPLVQEWLADETGLMGDDVMFLKADICRAELDLEMEAVVSRRTG